jgi:hypothetical protein
MGQQLLTIANSSTWWIADWLVYGEEAFQDRYHEAIRKTSLSYQTLRNYAWVARRLELPRRRSDLSFGHHAEVAALEAPEQDYWLRKAQELDWSRNQLRAEIRASLKERHSSESVTSHSAAGHGEASDGPEESSSLGPGTETLCLRLTSSQLAYLSAVARKQHLRVDEWAIQALREAATADDDSRQPVAS